MLTPVFVQLPTVGGVMSAKGSVNDAAPVCAAGWILLHPLQFPTIWVKDPFVVVIVPLPFVLIAELELELTITPQPLVKLGVPLISSALEADGFRTITQPPPLARRVPVKRARSPSLPAGPARLRTAGGSIR